MEYPKCKTCRHFQKITYEMSKLEGRKIIKVQVTSEGKSCTHQNVGELAYRSDGPYISYSYNEGGGMSPSDDFGCALHSDIRPQDVPSG